jgi:hypothetical protein
VKSGAGWGWVDIYQRLLVEDRVAEDSLDSGGAWRRSWTSVFPDRVRLSEPEIFTLARHDP